MVMVGKEAGRTAWKEGWSSAMKISGSDWGRLLVSGCSLRTLACAFHQEMPPRDRGRCCWVKALKKRGDKRGLNAENCLLFWPSHIFSSWSLPRTVFLSVKLGDSRWDWVEEWHHDVGVWKMLRLDFFPRIKCGNSCPTQLWGFGGRNNKASWSHITAQSHRGFSPRGNQVVQGQKGRKERLLYSCQKHHILTGFECGHGRLKANGKNLHCRMIQCS